jgi:hypothetical protein
MYRNMTIKVFKKLNEGVEAMGPKEKDIDNLQPKAGLIKCGIKEGPV